MTDTILNNKRRLERHSRRDGHLQSRTRPVMMERNGEQQDASSVAYIRSLVENAHLQFSRALIFGGGDGSSSSSGDGNSSSAASSSKDSESSAAASASKAAASRSSAEAATSTTRNIIDRFTSSTSTTPTTTSTSTTPTTTSQSSTSTHTRSTHSSTSTTSSSSDILTTTASQSSTSLVPTTSVAYVTSSATQSVANAASSSTSTAKADSGVGVGPIIGIVAGSLAGIAVIAVIVGYLFKKFGRKEDPYEADPFDREDFRRQSVLLQDGFESDDGHPNMSEYNNGGHFGHDAGYAGAGAALGGMAAASSFASHNESGGPRPPTMFQKHINGPAAQFNNHEQLPQIGAVYDPNDLTPQLPPMAFGGSDPYSIAGVGRNHHMDGNFNNPYAHLDRSPSNMIQVQRNVSQSGTGQYDGQADYADHDSKGSQGSYYQGSNQEQLQSSNDYESTSHGYDTAGRPGTAEGRSGTPDLPNVQQTYALGGTGNNQEMDRVASPHQMMSSPEHISHDTYTPSMYQETSSNNNSYQQPLQVRNLLPNPQNNQYQGQQRPISAVSSQGGDDEAAYGGVW